VGEAKSPYCSHVNAYKADERSRSDFFPSNWSGFLFSELVEFLRVMCCRAVAGSALFIRMIRGNSGWYDSCEMPS
jgi:hypothetical protein